jgi:hypothetical protein
MRSLILLLSGFQAILTDGGGDRKTGQRRLRGGIVGNDESSAIRQEMATIRRELNDKVENVVVQTKELADWRNAVRSHPWLCLASAVGVGYFLVPRRLHVMTPDADTLAKLASRNGLLVKPLPRSARSGGVFASLVNSLAGVALRGAITVAARYGREFWTNGLAKGQPQRRGEATDEFDDRFEPEPR